MWQGSLPVLVGLLVIAVVVGFWEWQVRREPIFFLPAPSAIFERLQSDWLSPVPAQLFMTPEGLAAITQTFATALIGWMIAAVCGVVIGATLGARPGLASFAAPPLLLLRSIPPISVIPIVIVIVGLGSPMRITVVVVGCIWPILLNSVAAVAGVDSVLRDVARLNRLGPVATFRRILLPAASPKIFAGLRVGLTLAIILAVGSDMFAGAGGIGGRLLNFQNMFDVPGLWAGIVVLAVLGAAVNGLFVLLERAVLRWNRFGVEI